MLFATLMASGPMDCSSYTLDVQDTCTILDSSYHPLWILGLSEDVQCTLRVIAQTIPDYPRMSTKTKGASPPPTHILLGVAKDCISETTLAIAMKQGLM